MYQNEIELIDCKCGCGNKTSKYVICKGRVYKTRPKKYIYGHGNMKGENHHAWKGDCVSYKTLHGWMRKNLPKPNPDVCQICKQDSTQEVSNKSGKYLRDLSDWWWLCRRCHKNYDNIKLNLKTNIIKKDMLIL